jgi:hypothetical protein
MMMRINYIDQEALAKTVEVKYINTHNQVADILTKPLALEQYAVLSDRLLRGFNGVPVTHDRISMFRLKSEERLSKPNRRRTFEVLGF